MSDRISDRKSDRMIERRTVVVTGATSGIGLAVLQDLAAKGWNCIAVGRMEQHVAEAGRTVRQKTPKSTVRWLICDLASMTQVRLLGERILGLLAEDAEEYRSMDAGGAISFPVACEPSPFPSRLRLDALVLCAGTVRDWYQATEDGYEVQFAVNHLSQFLLGNLLRPALSGSPAGKLVTVSSGSHFHTRMKWEDVMLRRHYGPLKAYKQSKLCNVLFAAEWNRWNASVVRAFAVDPGLVDTEIGQKGTGGLVNWFWKKRRRKGTAPEIPAATIGYLLGESEEKLAGHLYWKDARPVKASRMARSETEAMRLWSLSAMLCPGVALDRLPIIEEIEPEHPDFLQILLDSEAKQNPELKPNPDAKQDPEEKPEPKTSLHAIGHESEAFAVR